MKEEGRSTREGGRRAGGRGRGRRSEKLGGPEIDASTTMCWSGHKSSIYGHVVSNFRDASS